MGFFFLFAYFVVFCWKLNIFGNTLFAATLDTDSSSHSLFFVVVVYLFICFVPWLSYFGEVYFYHSMKPLVLFFRWHSLGHVHGHPGMTMVLAGLSLTVSFPDLSVKLSASFGITLSPEAPLIAG